MPHAARHPSSLVIIAARVIVGLTGDSAECAEAIDFWRVRDPQTLPAIAATAPTTGGVA